MLSVVTMTNMASTASSSISRLAENIENLIGCFIGVIKYSVPHFSYTVARYTCYSQSFARDDVTKLR